MYVRSDLSDHQFPDGCAMTIGTYDGLHLGHLSVINELQAKARTRGLPTALVTFDAHPRGVLRPGHTPRLLSDLAQKLELIEAAGLDAAYVLPFDQSVADETAEAFIRRVVVDGLQARVVVVGTDFRFGRDRRGDVEMLGRSAADHGFELTGVELLADGHHPDRKVSSSAIRAAIGAGRVDRAAEMLGRPHEVRGEVVTGDQRGRTIGFPTANVNVPNVIALPGDAVYAGWYVRPSGERFKAAINLGRRPTFYEHADVSLLEAHLLDFSGELYGEIGRVQFITRLRTEVTFDGIDGLKAQLARDVADTRTVLERY